MKLCAPLVAALALLLPSPPAAPGQRVQFGHDIVVASGEVIEEAVCFGCSVRVEAGGAVNGDVVAFGGSSEINGPVGGDLAVFGGSVRVDQPVGGDIAAFGGGSEINAPVGGDVAVFGGGVRLGPQAVVGGDVALFGGGVERDPEAKVGGEITVGPGLPVTSLAGLFFVLFALGAVFNLVMVLLTYLIAGERRISTIAGTVRARAGLSLVAGVAVIVGAVILFYLAAQLRSGTAVLAVATALGLALTLLVGYTGLSYWLGRGLLKGTAPLVAVLVGALLVSLLQAIPLVGFLIFLVFTLLALGSAAVSGYGTAADWLPQRLGGASAPPPRRTS